MLLLAVARQIEKEVSDKMTFNLVILFVSTFVMSKLYLPLSYDTLPFVIIHELSGEHYFFLGKLFVINDSSSIRKSRVVDNGCCVLLCSCIVILIEIDQINEEEVY